MLTFAQATTRSQAASPCGLSGLGCAQCPKLSERGGCSQLRGLGFDLPALPDLPSLGNLDWKIIAVVAAIVLVIGGGLFGRKRSAARRRAARRDMIVARLRYDEDAARIRRKSL